MAHLLQVQLNHPRLWAHSWGERLSHFRYRGVRMEAAFHSPGGVLVAPWRGKE